MERKQASDFHPEVLRWFDRFVHGQVDRRGFMNGVAQYAVGGVTAAMLLESLSPNFAEAQQVPPNDPRLNAKLVEYPSPEGSGKMRGYLVLFGIFAKLFAGVITEGIRNRSAETSDQS